MAKQRFLDWEEKGKAVITGASSGIGAEYARQLAGLGFTPVLIARRKEKLEKVAQDIKDAVQVTPKMKTVDLSDEEQVSTLADALKQDPRVEILVNNAGFGLSERFVGGNLVPHLDMMRVHMNAPVILSHAVTPNMVKNGKGAIVNTASMSAFNPGPGLYSPTKTFLLSFSEGLAMELEGTGVRVQALCPGFTHTEFHEDPGLATLKENTPKYIWGTVANVVSDSIKGLRKNKKIVIPGFVNKVIKIIPKGIRMRVLTNSVRKDKF